jgi:hypothetical protein
LNRASCSLGLVLVASAFCAAASASNTRQTIGIPAKADPLVGTWTWSGKAPGPTTLTITFNADKTFVFNEQVAPATRPVGVVLSGCVTTELYHGTYTRTGDHQLTWAFTDGTANAVAGCHNPADDSAGTPMTPDDVTTHIEQGHLPPTTVRFDATASILLLTSPDKSTAGVARGAGTTFTKVR